MAHAWHFESGHLSGSTVALAKAARDATILSEHDTIDPHDDVLFDAAVAAAQAVYAALDVPATGTGIAVRVESGCTDSGHLSPFVHLTKSWVLPGGGASGVHAWSTSAVGQLTAAERALAASQMAAVLAAKGRPVGAEDTAVLTALLAAAGAWLASVGVTSADVASSMSASVSDGDLSRVSVSLSVHAPTVEAPPAPAPTTGVISPPTLTADVNNYNPPGLASAVLLRLAGLASRNVTGLAAAGAARQLAIVNIGTFTISLRAESVLSAAGNRFASTANINLSANAAVILIYDPVSARWRPIAYP